MTTAGTPRPVGGGERRGPGPFITHQVRLHPDGGWLVASSRRHRKGLRPHRVARQAALDRLPATRARAFSRLFAPSRLAWWIGVLFMVGSAHFCVGGVAATWPAHAPAGLRDPGTLNLVFFVGSLFFTAAAWLQWLEAVNGDVADAFDARGPRPWRWWAWLPRNLGYLASTVQLVGTLLFNLSTADAIWSGSAWQAQDELIWLPNLLGCICFLAASYLAFVEVAQKALAFLPGSISWWIAVTNLLGSVAFQLSAFAAFVRPHTDTSVDLFWASAMTAAGAACFFLAAAALIPELFDE